MQYWTLNPVIWYVAGPLDEWVSVEMDNAMESLALHLLGILDYLLEPCSCCYQQREPQCSDLSFLMTVVAKFVNQDPVALLDLYCFAFGIGRHVILQVSRAYHMEYRSIPTKEPCIYRVTHKLISYCLPLESLRTYAATPNQ